MLSRRQRMVCFGVVGGGVGLLALRFGQVDDLLPANRALFVVVCALLTIWLLLHVSDPWWRQS